MTGDIPPTDPGTRLVGVDESNHRVGEDHHGARLTDAEVDLIRELYEYEGPGRKLSLREIAEKFEVSLSLVHGIVTYRKRVARPVGWRRVRVVIRGKDILDGEK